VSYHTYYNLLGGYGPVVGYAGAYGGQMSSTPKVVSYDDGKAYVEVRGLLLSRDEVETSRRLLSEHDAEAERKRLEEQKKKDEEAKRQATIALRASKHGMVRQSNYGLGYLLLDPEKVRVALQKADNNGGMVTLHHDGVLNYDPTVPATYSNDAPKTFTVDPR